MSIFISDYDKVNRVIREPKVKHLIEKTIMNFLI